MPSLKQIGTICFLFLISIFPTFADDEPTLIPTPASCNSSVLNTTEGSAALEAIYSPNTIGTTWYSDGVQLEVDNAATSCTYDTAMTLPTNPIKAGYEFNGWKIKRCEIPSSLVSTNGISSGYKGAPSGFMEAMVSNTADYDLTEEQTWGVTWENGDKVTGMALCNSTTQSGEGGTGDARYCWCKATHYTANGASQCSLSSPTWAYGAYNYSPSTCVWNCAMQCANNVKTDGTFRNAVFAGLVAE